MIQGPKLYKPERVTFVTGVVRVDAISQHSCFFFELFGSSAAAAKQCFNGAFAALAAPGTELNAKMGCGQGADTYVSSFCFY